MAHFQWDPTLLPDVLVISQMHDPYLWGIAGKGDDQVLD